MEPPMVHMMNMKMMNKHAGLLFALVWVLGLGACTTSKEEVQDGPSTGAIKVGVDESFQQVLKAEKDAFENNYHYAKIGLVWKEENEAIADLLNDKVRAVVVTRELNAKERAIFDRDQIKYRSFKYAADGIALLGHSSHTDTLITLPDLKQLLLGEKTTWASIGARQISGSITLVVDKANSSNLSFLVQRLNIDPKQSLKVFAAGSNPKVIEYVKTHPNAIGIIGSNWISDGDNPASLGFIRSVRVFSVAEKPGVKSSDYYQPFGYHLALKNYPLRREIKLILKEAHQGLGTGFINYLCGDMGQLIVLKSGLIPLTRPVTIRQYQINP